MRRPSLHKSSIVVGLLVAAALVLIEAPGRSARQLGIAPRRIQFEHGWPWVYLEREIDALWAPTAGDPTVPSGVPKWGIPWLSAMNWRFWESCRFADPSRWVLNGWRAAADLASALLAIATIVAAWEFRRRRRPRLVSFKLFDVFVLVTAVCLTLGWLAHLERESKREERLANLATTDFNGHPPKPWGIYDVSCVAPLWLRSLVGTDVFPGYFWRVASIGMSLSEVRDEDDLVRDLSQFAYLRHVAFSSGNGGGRFRFSVFRAMTQLDEISMVRARTLTSHDVTELAQLTQLRRLRIDYKDDVPRDTLTRLRTDLPNCQILDKYDEW